MAETEHSIEFIEDAVREMIWKVSEPLTSGDLLQIERAKTSMKQKFAHGFTQLLTLGLDEQGNEYEGLQLDCPIGQDSTCAELPVVEQSVRAGTTLTTVVTVHHRRDDEGGDVHVVTPCAMCIERYIHFHPYVRALIWFEGKIRKVPMRVLIAIPYKRRIRANGNGTSKQEFPN